MYFEAAASNLDELLERVTKPVGSLYIVLHESELNFQLYVPSL